MISQQGVRRFVAVCTVSIAVSACNSTPTRPSAVSPAAALGGAASLAVVNGVAELAEFEVCKQYAGAAGPAVTINYTVDFDGNGSIEVASSVSLADGQCAIVHTYQEVGSNNGTQVQRVTVTEQVPSGYSASFVKTTVTNSGSTTGPVTAGNSTSGDMQSNPDNGFLVVFTNTADPVIEGTGRFTGGANVRAGEARLSAGLTVHCDRLLSNNLQVNWPGNRFHMTEHLTTVSCTDDPGIDQTPPAAPLDTLVGTGTGRYNNVDGYTIEFTLVDAGEPGTNDRMAIRIYQTSNPSNVVFNQPLQTLSHGNLQAHFDQPHR